ncbi:hypothetical protein IIY59_02770 [Candidatus Saccharibacteria bacterium]|nr:hypothetical protein [Candidatus Saccharibacteria bacterium]
MNSSTDSSVKSYHRLDSIEETKDFVAMLKRDNLAQDITPESPYCMWSLALSDQENGFIDYNSLGANIADFRRGAEQIEMPFTLITPLYSWTAAKKIVDLKVSSEYRKNDYEEYGFNKVDSINLNLGQKHVSISVFEKTLGSTHIVGVAENNFGIYRDVFDGSNQALYQSVILGFGGYIGLKLVGIKPSVIQLVNAASCFAALARLDELIQNGMNFYEAMVYTRKHTIFSSFEAVDKVVFSRDQFLYYVLPNLKSEKLKKWLMNNFQNNLDLRELCIEMSELKISPSRVMVDSLNDWKLVSNGINFKYWLPDDVYNFYMEKELLDQFELRKDGAGERIEEILAEDIKRLKNDARMDLNTVLNHYFDQKGLPVALPNDSILISAIDCFNHFSQIELLFDDSERLGDMLETHNAYIILCGGTDLGDTNKSEVLRSILSIIEVNPILHRRVHHIIDADELLVKKLLAGSDVILNLDENEYNSFDNDWMRAIINMNILVTTTDNDLIDSRDDACLTVMGDTKEEEIESLYLQLETALSACISDFDIEYWCHHGLDEFMAISSSTRMIKDYLQYVF